LGGHLACGGFDAAVRKRWNVPKRYFRETVGEIPPDLTGLVERVFFSALVAADANGYPPAMIAWLAVKLAASWTWPELERKAGDGRDFAAEHAAYHSMRKSRIVSMLTGMV
jgi:hypothetical protein